MSWSVLAVDQSMTSTGWAHLRDGQQTPTWGIFTQPSWEDREGEMLWKWFSWLGKKVSELQVTHLVLEDTFRPDHQENLTKGIAQYGQLGMASAVAHLCTAERNHPVEFTVAASKTWRATFLGSAEPPRGLVKHQRRAWFKDRAVSECHKRGWMVSSNDAADALGILDYACSAIDPRYASQAGSLFRRAEAHCEEERRTLR